MPRIIPISIVTTLLFANASWAQTLPDPIIDLDPVYSAPIAIVEKSEITSTGRIDVVSEDILEALQATDLTSALRRVPGITISRYNPVGAYGGSDGGGVFIRGHGSGRPGAEIATMIEGVPLFVGIWTHPLIDTLSIDLAQSVEVIKSPQPTRVGNMGFGAVNLIAKQASEAGHHGAVEASYGHFDTSLLKAEYAIKKGNSGLIVSASQRESEGHRQNADGNTQALYANFTHAFSEHWNLSLLTSSTHSEANDPEPTGTALPIVESYETTHQFYLGKLEYSSDSLDFIIKLHLEDGEGNWLQWHQAPPPPFPSQSLRSITDYQNYGLKSELSGNHLSFYWKAGFDWDHFGGSLAERYERSSPVLFDDQYFEILSPKASLTKSFEFGTNQKLSINTGLRSLHHSEFETEWAGQFGFQLETDQTVSYLQMSRSANYPGVFVSVFGRRPPPWQVGTDWQQLEAETITHLEIGTQWNIRGPFVLDFSLFQDEVSNAIRLVTPPPAGYILNLGSYEVQGSEIMLRYQQQHWSIFSSLTFMDSPDEIPNTPEWTATIGFHFRKGPWMFASDFQRISSQFTYNPRFDQPMQSINAYQLLSAKLSYETGSQALRWQWYLSGENLANQPYEYRPGYPMPGISLTLGTKLSW